MTLTDLRYLVALARERHFGRAAEMPCQSANAVGGHQKLEEQLGVLLSSAARQTSRSLRLDARSSNRPNGSCSRRPRSKKSPHPARTLLLAHCALA